MVVTITPFYFSHFDTIAQPNEGVSIAHCGDLGTSLESGLKWNTHFVAANVVVKNFHLRKREILSAKAKSVNHFCLILTFSWERAMVLLASKVCDPQ